MAARLLSLIALASSLIMCASFPSAQSTKPCSAPEYRQFDFWIGEWEVQTGGQFAGTNAISSEYGGCVIVERWVGAKGLTGSSLNIYDSATRQWHQTWVDSSGSLLLLRGEFKDGAMRLASAGTAGMIDRITWTPHADGSLRQLWEQSKDGGDSWTVAFDGLYRRKTAERE
jgi:hypothetical protein